MYGTILKINKLLLISYNYADSDFILFAVTDFNNTEVDLVISTSAQTTEDVPTEIEIVNDDIKEEDEVFLIMLNITGHSPLDIVTFGSRRCAVGHIRRDGGDSK